METDIKFLANIKIILTPNEMRYLHKVLGGQQVGFDDVLIHDGIYANLEYVKSVIDERGETRDV